MKNIIVEPYNPVWKRWFNELHARIWPAVSQFANSLEHIGSTSIEGLAAKPRIDMDIIVEDEQASRNCIVALENLGYVHRGDLGIKGREAFKCLEPVHDHNLYVCLKGCDSLKNHLTLRDHLLNHPDDVKKYSDLKLALATKYTNDIDSYVEGKTEFILSILSKYEFSSDVIAEIKEANAKKQVD